NQTPMRCNVRIIAATHRNLEEAIQRGAFREDLFHRLNVFPIEMPPLRARIEDLPLLVRDCIATNLSEGRGRVQLSPRVLGALALCPWTGNVRELANLIERLSIVCAGRVVEVRDLPPKYRPPVDWTLEIKALDPSQMIAREEEHLTEETALSVLEEVELESKERAAVSNGSNTADSVAVLPEQG